VPNASNPEPALSSYQMMGARIQRIINSPSAQKAKSALLYRSPDEPESDWERILGEISENDNVTLTHREDGAVQLFWTLPQED
jgi:hypothetical protein